MENKESAVIKWFKEEDNKLPERFIPLPDPTYEIGELWNKNLEKLSKEVYPLYFKGGTDGYREWMIANKYATEENFKE